MQNRPFQDAAEMNNVLIHNLNVCVKPDDKLYILGDISHHISPEESNALIRRIHGKKYLLLGNHDVTGDPEVCQYDMNLFQWVGSYLKINAYHLNLIMMHYPMLTWPKVMAGSVMLHGHIHAGPAYNEANQKAGIRRYDVGVDANNYYPVSIEQIRSWAEKTPVTITPRTNLYIPGVWRQEPVSLAQYEAEHPDRKLVVYDAKRRVVYDPQNVMSCDCEDSSTHVFKNPESNSPQNVQNVATMNFENQTIHDLNSRTSHSIKSLEDHTSQNASVHDFQNGSLERTDYHNDPELLKRPVLDAHAVSDGFWAVTV